MDVNDIILGVIEISIIGVIGYMVSYVNKMMERIIDLEKEVIRLQEQLKK